MLLSVDWDFFSGCVEHVFDAPIWGSRDTEYERVEAWQARAAKRNGDLDKDFPLYENWAWLLQFSGVKAYATVSHADAYGLLERHNISNLINLDSHHDLFSLSGNPSKVRPGNWAGIALQNGLIKSYTCVYPTWHANVRVTEGYDLARTRNEMGSRFEDDSVTLLRTHLEELELKPIDILLLVQSPAWTNPEHDRVFLELCTALKVEYLEKPLQRTIKSEKEIIQSVSKAS
jgi:hypothetical protein